MAGLTRVAVWSFGVLIMPATLSMRRASAGFLLDHKRNHAPLGRVPTPTDYLVHATAMAVDLVMLGAPPVPGWGTTLFVVPLRLHGGSLGVLVGDAWGTACA